MEYIVGTIIGAIIALIGGVITAIINQKAIERTTTKSLEEYSRLLLKDLEKTGQEIKAKIGVEVLSKNRQEWINSLRTIVASILTANDNLKKEMSMYIADSTSVINSISNINSNYVSLSLFLNPIENNNKALLRLIRRLKKEIFNIQNIFIEIKRLQNLKKNGNLINEIPINKRLEKLKKNLYFLDKLITRKTQKILKIEWERVKKGI